MGELEVDKESTEEDNAKENEKEAKNFTADDDKSETETEVVVDAEKATSSTQIAESAEKTPKKNKDVTEENFYLKDQRNFLHPSGLGRIAESKASRRYRVSKTKMNLRRINQKRRRTKKMKMMKKKKRKWKKSLKKK